MNGKLNFTGIKGRDQIIALWDKAEPLIQKAINVYDEHSINDIFSSLVEMKSQLWVAGHNDIEAILITQIITRNNKQVCLLELCAGRGVESIQFLKTIELWAKDAGCCSIELIGRPGWKRVLRDYKTNKITLTKEI